MQKIAKTLNNGGIAVIPTDTVYGIVGKAVDKNCVKRIFELKDRENYKPFIILISSIDQLIDFGLEIDTKLRAKLKEFWPGANSLVLGADSSDLEYLHYGMKSLAFRLPDDDDLQSLIEQTGPLVAPSANPNGLEIAKNSEEARVYFGDKIDAYHGTDHLKGEPSQLWKHVGGLQFEKISRN